MEPKLHGASISTSDLPLHIPVEWLIRALVLCSMLLQVFLVFGGAFRYRSSSHVLRLVVWLTYMSADVVAISALGIMTHSVQTQIYGVWAPLLLLHLGGPDTITAYSTADNELWIRHGLIMIYQVSVAAYVIYLSSLQGYLLASAILLFIAGAIKYGERTLALRYASYSQIVSSTQPVYKFMQHEHEIDKEIEKEDYNYLVMGEEQFQHNLKEKQKDAEQRNKNRSSLPEEAEGVRRRYDSWNSLLKGREIVTIKNVWYQEGLQTTGNYILCLSHALFKMYKRRFVSLYFHEGIRQKTRKFFINERLPDERLFEIVETELKFMYDALFSKSSGTAFSTMGTLIRLLSTCSLGVAGMLLYTGANVKQAQKFVTYVLISVALAVEFYQLCRIAQSDWTMVRLICAYIQLLRRPSPCGLFKFKFIQLATSLVGRVRKTCPNKYWKKSITQYSVMDACSSKWSSIWHVFQRVRKIGDLIVPPLLKLLHTKEEPVQDTLRSFIFQKVKAKCSPDQEVAYCRARVYNYDEYLDTMGYEDLQWASDLDMEELILTWHIATTICEIVDIPDAVLSSAAPGVRTAAAGVPTGDGVNLKKISTLLSRYCAYLLVSNPNLLPLHPDIAKISYIELHYELVPLLKNGAENWNWREFSDKNSILGFGARLARELIERRQELKWEILSEWWAELLIFMAFHHKASFHAESLACGGEFLSQIWVLLGHMGCGEQSDTAVTKKKEELEREIEKEEDKRTKREEKEIRDWEEEKMFSVKRRRKWRENAGKQERLKASKAEDRKMRREEAKKQKASERLKRVLLDPSHA